MSFSAGLLAPLEIPIITSLVKYAMLLMNKSNKFMLVSISL